MFFHEKQDWPSSSTKKPCPLLFLRLGNFYVIYERNLSKFRSSRPEVFCKRAVLGNFAKFTGKHQCHSLFFNKVAGIRPATLLKRSRWYRCFPINFAKFLRAPFLTEHLQWLQGRT